YLSWRKVTPATNGMNKPGVFVRPWSAWRGDAAILFFVALAMLLWAYVLSAILPFDPETRVRAAITLERASAVGSGLSLVAPLLFAAGCIYLWGLCHLDRRRLLDGLHFGEKERWAWLFTLLGDAPEDGRRSIELRTSEANRDEAGGALQRACDILETARADDG